LRLGPPHQLEVMVKGGHLEDALLAQFVAPDLQHDGEGLNHENAADEGQQQFLPDNHRDGSDRPSESERSNVAHEDFGRMSVIPKKTNAGSRHAAAEDGYLAH